MLILRSRKQQSEQHGGERRNHGGGRFDRLAPRRESVDFECTITISGIKYDLSSWANAHPGGALILKKFNGKDATNAFKRTGHSQQAHDLLRTFATDGSSTKKLPTSAKPGVWRRKIFTHEDPRNIHKYCGLFVLIHFAFRFYQMLMGDISAGFGSRMGKGASLKVISCLIPHVVLSLSSLIFHTVPKERIVGQPMIWQEFRAHSIIFAMRSISATVCAWTSVYFQHKPIVRTLAVTVSSLSVIFAIFAADKATKKLCISTMESTTATMPYWANCSVATQRRFKSFYAYCQFMATLACLTVSNPSWSFAVLFPIQLAAFLMTMVRKGFISTSTYHMLYTISLILPYIVAARSMLLSKTRDPLVLILLGYLLYRIRCLGVGKYSLWVPLVVLRILIGDNFITYDIW